MVSLVPEGRPQRDGQQNTKERFSRRLVLPIPVALPTRDDPSFDVCQDRCLCSVRSCLTHLQPHRCPSTGRAVNGGGGVYLSVVLLSVLRPHGRVPFLPLGREPAAAAGNTRQPGSNGGRQERRYRRWGRVPSLGQLFLLNSGIEGPRRARITSMRKSLFNAERAIRALRGSCGSCLRFPVHSDRAVESRSLRPTKYSEVGGVSPIRSRDQATQR